MQAFSLPDLTAPGIHNLGAYAADNGVPQIARSVILTTSGTIGSTVGDANVGAARGARIPGENATSGGPLVLPLNGADPVDRYNLNQLYVYVVSGGTVQISYVV